MIILRGLRQALRPCLFSASHTSNNLSTLHEPPRIEAGTDLFHYTSGSYNESSRLKERILHFNVDALKSAAATAVGKDVADIQRFYKLAEGGFNRAFELMIDGRPVIARLPYPSTYPKYFTVASEVATMDLARSYGVPVPKVLSYSATDNNAVGAEYIIMEKAKGKDLGDIWYDLAEKERIKIVVQVTRIESILFSIPLPSHGSVYYKCDLEGHAEAVDISSGQGASTRIGQLCIGPDVAQKWWYDRRDELAVPNGPFLHADQAFIAGAEKELAWLKTYARSRLPRVLPHGELHNYKTVTPCDHMVNIEKYLQIAPHLIPGSEDYLLRPTLRHSDLQPRNIFVTEDFTVTGIIDWQHCSVLPLVLQAGVPEYFQNFGDDESLRLKKPTLPRLFDSMSEEDQAQALELHRRRQLHYYYFVATYKHNKPHFDALRLDSTMSKQKLLQHASTPWEGDNISLKAELIRAVENWSMLTAGGNDDNSVCPISFSDNEIAQCLRIEAEQIHVDLQMEKLRDRIGIGTDGWTSIERYNDALEENEHVKAEALEGVDALTKTEILQNWPFDNHADG